MIAVLTFAGVTLLTFIAFHLIVTPFMKIQSYKKEGVTTYFFPVLGFLKYLTKDFAKTGDILTPVKEASKENPNQKYMVTNLITNTLFVLRGTEYIKEFIQKQSLYRKIKAVHAFKHLGGNSLGLLEGDDWKKRRKLISNAFHFDFLKEQMKCVQETAREALNNISEEDMNKYSIISKMQEITGQVVCRIFFGKSISQYRFEGKSLTDAAGEIVAEVAHCTRTPLVVFFGPKIMEMPFIPRYAKIMKRIKAFRKLCFDIVQSRKATKTNEKDLLSALLATQNHENPDMRISDEDIVSEFIFFFIAGMDSTGDMTGMTIYNITRNPEYIRELRQERENTYNKDKDCNIETLQKMNVVHSFLKETLRLYSPTTATFIREAQADHKILDLEIKKGQLVRSDFFFSYHHAGNFKNPEEFNPARWRDPNFTVEPFAFTPFSAGARNCPGQHLALLEAKIIISEFLERFDFQVEEGYKLRMTMRFLYEPYDEIFLKLTPKYIAAV